MKCLKMALVNLPRFFSTLSPSIHPHRPFQPLTFSSTSLRPLRCRVASPDPPPPPHNSDPPPGKDSTQLQSKFFNFTYVLF
ncbi:hypothetical protein TSUD_260830 [Trifolium subterraneum]|uniref:Uncharacterized protein n=1 Tax=Trifolium subterraneum TaxID=3900 RepID=A0A2Z6LXY1_TRISU|nr:hypothetical protein TSUD_260830 [Trifolium subterraneum]